MVRDDARRKPKDPRFACPHCGAFIWLRWVIVRHGPQLLLAHCDGCRMYYTQEQWRWHYPAPEGAR